MELVGRDNVQGYVKYPVVRFIDELLPYTYPSMWINRTEEQIRTSAKIWIREQMAYAIFSHRWLEMGELTFQDVSKLAGLTVEGFQKSVEDGETKRTGRDILDLATRRTFTNKQGSGLLKGMKKFCDGLSPDQRMHCQDLVKLVEFCNVASQYGCKYVWFDTGCIDKSKRDELEESIRSMFNWYRDAKICIVHLAESTNPRDLPRDPWFTRGWTLQELLAPKRILFFGKSWDRITTNTKENDKVSDAVMAQGIPLWKTISEVTGIDTKQLLHFDAGIAHARDALTWISRRQTKRTEDMAYCLAGLLKIPMSVAYGEGDTAFHRLQVEILQRSGDMGLFAWTGPSSSLHSMLAANAGCFSPLPLQPLATEPTKDPTFSWNQPRLVDRAHVLTNKGLRISLVVYNAEIRSQENVKSSLVKYRLRLTELHQRVTIVSSDSDLGRYHYLGIAVLPELADNSGTLAILLGMHGNRCTRIPTQKHIVLSPIPTAGESFIRFIE